MHVCLHTYVHTYRHMYTHAHLPAYMYMLQDEWTMLDIEAILSLFGTLWENPSLLNPYNVMCDIINDIMTSPKIYTRQSI